MAEPPIRPWLFVQPGASPPVLRWPPQRRALATDPPRCNLGIGAGLRGACVGRHSVSHRHDNCRHSDDHDTGRDAGAAAAEAGAPLQAPHTSATLEGRMALVQRELLDDL